ncbi:hypothetical protein FQZ97_864050 [compost metagenome]
MLAAPMQQIKVEVVGAQALEAALAGQSGARAAGVPGIDLADQEHLLPKPGDGLAHYLLGAAFGVHLGGVDQFQAQFQALAQGRDFALALAAALAHVPGALANGRHLGAVGEGNAVHGSVLGKSVQWVAGSWGAIFRQCTAGLKPRGRRNRCSTGGLPGRDS